jgi:hypothetical protein
MPQHDIPPAEKVGLVIGRTLRRIIQLVGILTILFVGYCIGHNDKANATAKPVEVNQPTCPQLKPLKKVVDKPKNVAIKVYIENTERKLANVQSLNVL